MLEPKAEFLFEIAVAAVGGDFGELSSATLVIHSKASQVECYLLTAFDVAMREPSPSVDWVSAGWASDVLVINYQFQFSKVVVVVNESDEIKVPWLFRFEVVEDSSVLGWSTWVQKLEEAVYHTRHRVVVDERQHVTHLIHVFQTKMDDVMSWENS